jgi:hypothetical protein
MCPSRVSAGRRERSLPGAGGAVEIGGVRLEIDESLVKDISDDPQDIVRHRPS